MEAKPVGLMSRNGELIAYRSTLEARWAYYFDTMGFAWTYEPFRFELAEGFTYTPDFEVSGIGIIEIKPTLESVIESRRRIGLFLSQSGRDRMYLFYGSPFNSSVLMLRGNPMSEVPTSRTQRNIILGGVNRRELAKRDYSAFCDSINIALRSASGKITTEILTAGDKMKLRDTRDFSLR